MVVLFEVCEQSVRSSSSSRSDLVQLCLRAGILSADKKMQDRRGRICFFGLRIESRQGTRLASL
jgi:hypothetical protein